MTPTSIAILLILAIITGLVFALSNGLHDASSVVATFIACGAATPQQAIVLAAFFGLLGAILGGNAVADTISKVIDLPVQTSLLVILLAAILGAVVWNLVTWRLGLPSSSTHALIGGIIGSVWVSAGYGHILWGWSELVGKNHEITGIVKVVAALIFSPLLGFCAAFVLGKVTKLSFRNAPYSLNIWLKRVQWVLASLLAFSHGSNDTQKIIGIIALALAAGGGAILENAPLWVRVCGGLVMFMGTMIGGWTIMKTIGRGIFTLRPIHSANSQFASVVAVSIATLVGAPVSTTHVVVGSVMGVGAADEYKMVNWGIAREIVIAWFVTIPFSALVSAIIYLSINTLFRTV